MEADVSISRDQPVPMLDIPISFPTVSLTDLNEYDNEETMIFDNLPLHGFEETFTETNGKHEEDTDLESGSTSCTKWFEIDLDKGRHDSKPNETRKFSSIENLDLVSRDKNSSETRSDNFLVDGDDVLESIKFKTPQSKYTDNIYITSEENCFIKERSEEKDEFVDQSDQLLNFTYHGIKEDTTSSKTVQGYETESLFDSKKIGIDKTIVDHDSSIVCFKNEHNGDANGILEEHTSGTKDRPKAGEQLCCNEDGDAIKGHLRTRKRKQNNPTMIIQEYTNIEHDTDSESDSEWLSVKKRPLFSNLRIPKKTICCKKQAQRESSLSRCDIIEIIEDSLRTHNVPVTTNRYRRHLLKKSQKVSTLQSQMPEESESQSNDVFLELTNSSVAKGVNDTSNGKVPMVKEKDFHNDGALECNLCGKHFTTNDTLSAHYECHRRINKDFENNHCLSLINTDNENDGLPDDVNVKEDLSDSEDESIASSCVDSEQSGSKQKEHLDTDVLETSTYFCQVCQTRFTNISALQNHVADHSLDGEQDSDNEAKGDHYCAVCQKNFASAGSLHVHNKIHSGDNPYTCPTCNKSFRDKTRLTTHIRVHTGEKPFLCSICHKSFSQKGNLKLHQKIHTGERNCICQVCGNGFRSRSDLVRHMKVHGLAISSGSENEDTSPKAPVAMTMASPLRLQQESHDAHTRFHRSNKIKDLLKASDNITPISTLQGVTNMNELLKLGVSSSPRRRPSQDGHEGYHRNDPFQEKMLPNFPGIDPNTYLMNLNREVEFIKAVTEAKMRSEATSMKSYVCPLCGLSLTSFDAFNHHVLLQHNPLTTFGPPIPNAAFGPTKAPPNKHTSPSIFTLLDPFLSVPKNDKFKCKDCNEVFHTNEDLTVHSKTHRTKPTDTKATVMARDNGVGSFLSSKAIMEDMKFSANEKVYSCEFCGKTFRRSHHLQTHMRTHTGDRPYTCVECNKCFARGDHLQNHRRTHTGEKPYHCDICNRSYSQSHHLLRHKRTHTGERPYHCNICEKTFSRDHHLKKHLETHRGVTDTRPAQIDNKTESRSARMQNLPDVPFNMTTRSTNRIGQLMMDMQAENSASKLMESMIKRHLKEEEDRKVFKYESGDNTPTENTEKDNRHKAETLKITDILNDEIDKRVTSHISTDLILDHVMRLARHKPVGNVVESQPLDRSIKQKEGSLFTSEASNQSKFSREEYEHPRVSDHSLSSNSSQNQIHEKLNEALYSHISIDAQVCSRREDRKHEIFNQIMDRGIHRSSIESKGCASKLEPQTLDDIILKSLQDEYNIKHN